MRRIVVALLLLFGVEVWLVAGRSDYGRLFQLQLLMLAVAVGLAALVPPVGRLFMAALERIRHPSRRTQLVVAACIAVIVWIYLPFTGWRQGRNFEPKWQDEMSYIIQFRMLAQGRLWMPRHELGDFFDSFQLIIEPVYASMYFPGAAFLYTPAVLLGVPFWVMSVLASGISAALLYRIMTELIDGLAGVLSVLMLVGLMWFRRLSLMIGGHPPVVMVQLAMIFCYLRWRERRSAGWALALGAFAGWGAVIRPLDAVVVAFPIGLMMLVDLWREPLRRWLVTGGSLLAAAGPFLAVQLIFNIGVTGTWYRTPFDHYADRDYPGTRLGFHRHDPNVRPVSPLPQKQKYYDDFAIPAIKRHQPENLFGNWLGRRSEHGELQEGDLLRAISSGLPNRLLMVLLPVGVLGLLERRRLAVWLALPAFVIGFSFYTFSLPHYAIITAPAVILWVLAGAHVVENAWPRLRAPLASFLTLAIAILSVTETAEFNRLVIDELFDPPGLRNVQKSLEALQRRPTVVLFRWHPSKVGDEEPVYNIESAWPDDAEIVRGHDLRERNIEIFRYYARHQPQRAFYLYDRGDDSITYLGTARELAER